MRWVVIRLRYAALSCLVLFSGCGSSETVIDKGPVTGRLAGFNLLLVTLDTTRADHLGCYGREVARTPTLDALSQGGVRFDRAYTGVPLTLPSHCSLMTGRYPKEHGVHDNGRKSLPEDLPTLAAIFAAEGYDTAAFVASFVLAARFGVNQGFETYADDLEAGAERVELIKQELPADRVADRAIEWLRARNEKPFLCWVHFFDAHDPYEPPAGFTGFGTPYDGELAFIDFQLKRILDALELAGQRERTLVVVAGDHGESFGEHGNEGHTIFLYETNLRVPLLFNQPEVLPEGRVVEDLVELVDVFPTLLELYGLPISNSLLSRSLVSAIEGLPLNEQPVYSENEYVTSAYGWAQQRSLIAGKWKYISSAAPELYDLESDPEERHNVLEQHPEIAQELRELLVKRHGGMKPGSAKSVEHDAAALEAIAKLGYSASSSKDAGDEFLTEGLPDPKAMLPSLQLHRHAKAQAARGDFEGALRSFEKALQVNPTSVLMHYDMAIAYLDSNRALEAVRALENALSRDPQYLPALVSMGEALTALGKRDEAVLQYQAALKLVERSPEIHAVLANELKQLGRSEEALEHFSRALEYKPGWGQVELDLGILLDQAQRSDEAETHLRNALAHAPTNDFAVEALSQHYLRLGQDERALAILRQGRRAIPTSLRVANGLARLLATSNEASVRNGKEALALATEFCRQNGNRSPELLSTLACAQAETGRFQEAIATIDLALERARALPPDASALIQRLGSQGVSYASGLPTRGASF